MIASIDSFKMRVPLSVVHFYDSQLIDRWTYVSECGVIDSSDFKHRRIKHDEHGIKTSFLIELPRGKYQKEKQLTILINSKLLAKSYFRGINYRNWTVIYERIMNLGYFHIKPIDFLSAHITDVDIKRDFRASSRQEQEYIVSMFKASTKASQERDKGAKVFNKSSNLGIMWSTRDRATNSNPFVKLYAKDLDFKHQPDSQRFAHKFGHTELKPILRLEATIKDKRHFHYLTGIEKDVPLTLNTLLLQSKGKVRDLDLMLQKMTKQHLDYVGQRTSTGKLTASEVMIKSCLQIAEPSEVAVLIDRFSNDRHQRKRLLDGLNKITAIVNKNFDYDYRTDRKLSVFKYLFDRD